jgi:hypothetical protein
MTTEEMCRWLEVPATTPVPRKIAEALGGLRYPGTAAEDRQALSACLSWTPPRSPLPAARMTGFHSTVRAGYSF